MVDRIAGPRLDGVAGPQEEAVGAVEVVDGEAALGLVAGGQAGVLGVGGH